MPRRALLAAAIAVVALAGTAGADAAPTTDRPAGVAGPLVRQTAEPAETTLGQLISDPRRIHPEVLDGIIAHDSLLGERGRALVDLKASVEQQRLRADRAETEEVLRTRTARDARNDADHQEGVVADAVQTESSALGSLRSMSVDAFINHREGPELTGLLQASNEQANSRATQLLRTERIIEATDAELVGQRLAAGEDRRLQEDRLEELHSRVARELQLLDQARKDGLEAEAELARLEPQVGPAERRFERNVLLRNLPGTDNLQVVAIDAYYNASRIAHQQWPGCRLSWHQLAGVGRVESFHGNFGASSVDTRGQTSPRILGPQLNGDPWLAIPDTDGGVLDGDLEWDRAVGPMQFIPTSWELFAGDGNGDGQKDPHNLYDATVAAADHLCGSGLDDPERFRRALLGYNRSVQYGSDVMDYADYYRQLADIADPWTADQEG